MTVKFNRALASTFFSAPDHTGLTIPASPTTWALGIVVCFDGLTTGDNPQYLVSTKSTGQAGAFNLAYLTDSAATAAQRNRLSMYFNTLSTPTLVTANDNRAGDKWLFVFQQTGTTITVRRCPILAAMPTDGSAVVADGTAERNAVLDGSGLWLGARANLTADRMCDQSIGRVFFMADTLSDLEVAKLAHGMEITDLGKATLWYARLDNADDFSNRGSLPIAFTKNGPIATSESQPAFGYSAAIAKPVMNGAPAIVGAQVGQAASYTPAGASNSAGRTQEWYVAGVLVGTASTYTPVAADAGKDLVVRQIEANAAGSVSADSAPTTIPAVATDTVDLIPGIAERIYQRIGTTAAVPFEGAYAGTKPTSIEYQLYAEDGVTVVRPWGVIAGATIANGTWSGLPSVPQGGMYRRAVRSKNGSTVLATSAVGAELFGVGDLFAYAGSSSAEKRFDSTSGTGFVAAANVRKYSSAGWGKFGTNGCGIIEANGFAQKAGVPVGLIDYGYGGSTLAQWITLTHARWTNFRNAINAVGGKIAGVLIFIGSNDAADNLIVSRAQHAANLRTLISRIRLHTEQLDLPILISGFNRRTSSTADTQANFVRMAENDVGNDEDVCHVQTLDLLLSGDGVHLSTAAAGFPASANRNVAVFGAFVYDGVYRRGPAIVGMAINGTSGVVELVHRNGSDITPAAGITGFVASDVQGVAIEITAAVRVDATHIGLTFASTPAALTYLAGAAPAVGTPVFDNGATALPMHVQAEPLAAADTTVPTFQGELAASVTADSITVSWAGTTSADNVAVVRREYRIGGTGQYVAATAAEEGSKSHTFTNLAAGTAYQIDVRCVDSSGNVSAAIRIVPTTSAAPVVQVNYVRCILASRDGTPHLNLANVDWALFRSLSPASFGAPLAQGRHSMGSGNAAFEVTVPAATVPSGEYMLVLAESNGTMTLASPISVGQ